MDRKILIVLVGVVLFSIVVLSLKTCGKRNTIIGKPDVVMSFSEDDSEVRTAIETAKKTFPKFLENWKATKNQGYSLKFAVPNSKGGFEHIWFNPISIDGETIKAVCANDPENVPGLKCGDTREFKKSDLSDWMIMLDGKCYGGYTIRVLSKRDPSQKPPFEFGDF